MYENGVPFLSFPSSLSSEVPIDIKASEPGEWHGYIRIRGAWVAWTRKIHGGFEESRLQAPVVNDCRRVCSSQNKSTQADTF